MSNIIHSDDDVRIWFATELDEPFVSYLCKRFRSHEFFFAPDYVICREIQRRNIICFDYGRLEAGYIWVTFPPNGRTRINQIAVDEQLWRNKVGTKVVKFLEDHVAATGGWSVYLSCNSNTPGHLFWPQQGYAPIIEKPAGYRGGLNVIWAKIISDSCFLFPPSVEEVKSASSYKFQSSITAATVARRAASRAAAA